MNQLLIATNNTGKVNEFHELLKETGIELVMPAAIGLNLEVTEDGQTYAENAAKKAAAFAQASGLISLADDSGLEVDALDGAPGLYSARYAGPGASDADRRRKLLHELRHIPPPRPARFVCAVAVAQPLPYGRLDVVEFLGEVLGEIALAEHGENGFGYDPLFYIPDRGATLAELPDSIKNQISHRARAFQSALPHLQSILAA